MHAAAHFGEKRLEVHADVVLYDWSAYPVVIVTS
jgi:hypothetical protein